MEQPGIPNQPAAPTGTDPQVLVQEVARPMFEAKGWMQLLAVVLILEGILAALTIVGIIFAWLPIWLGIVLFKAGSAAETAMYTGDKFEMIRSLRSVKTFFMINGIMMLIIVGLFATIFFLGGMAAFMGM